LRIVFAHKRQLLLSIGAILTRSYELQRFKQLTTDARLSVLVTQHETLEQKLNIGRRVLPTLQAAVLSSRWVCISFSESSLKRYALLPHSLGLPSTPMASWASVSVSQMASADPGSICRV